MLQLKGQAVLASVPRVLHAKNILKNETMDTSGVGLRIGGQHVHGGFGGDVSMA